MIDLNEELIPLSQAARHFPAPAPPHVGTVVRWALKGVGRDRVKLETVKVGGRRFTSRAAILRFLVRLTGEAEARRLLARERIQAMWQAELDLDRDGIGD
jgi:hypothetical protein